MRNLFRDVHDRYIRLIRRYITPEPEINEWNEEENAPETTAITLGINVEDITPNLVNNIPIRPNDLADGDMLHASTSGHFTIQTPGIATTNQMYTITDGQHISFSNDYIDNFETPTVILSSGEITVDSQMKEPIIIRVDREIFDIEETEEGIEIRRKFDNESNNIREHSEPTILSVHRSEDLLQ